MVRTDLVLSRLLALATSFLALIAVAVLIAPSAEALPPGIPSAATARSELSGIPTKEPGSTAGYSRDKFPTWDTISGTCDTRETVLKRDGTNVVPDSACAATSGTWVSAYDGATWHAASDLDIDHVVPLAAAWRAGASSWTTDRREAFANDVSGPQLIAVTDNVNESKGDQTPDLWKPPSTGFWCTYARMWIGSKSKWGLSASAAEKSALSDMLDRC